MFEKFFPDFLIDKTQDIHYEFLKRNGIRGLILDIDNTLVPNHVKEADEAVVRWMERIKSSGIKVCIVSNASQKRVVKFNERLKVYAIHRANKPGTKNFLQAARLMALEPKEIAVVGDQIFTDVYGGNKAEMKTILVKPIDKREVLFVRLKRYPEKLVLSKYKRKYGNSGKTKI